MIRIKFQSEDNISFFKNITRRELEEHVELLNMKTDRHNAANSLFDVLRRPILLMSPVVGEFYFEL